MNVFVLSTGRSGTTTFIKACSHITNYSAAHESLSRYVGAARFSYPNDHIEADNHLSWHLGRLDQNYGSNAFYVHLLREQEATACSFASRYNSGIMLAYRTGILMGGTEHITPLMIANDYYATINANMNFFYVTKSIK